MKCRHSWWQTQRGTISLECECLHCGATAGFVLVPSTIRGGRGTVIGPKHGNALPKKDKRK